MTELAVALCSITATQRRRYFWAAWWTGAPTLNPFRKPDAANGGARSEAEALAEAERVAGRALTLGPAFWARGYKRTLRGDPPFTPRELAAASTPAPKASDPRPTRASAWTVLGVEDTATLEQIKRAYKRRVLETHPDQGGDPEVFRAVQRAYDKLLAQARKPKKRARAAHT